jgi:glycosyltransferase involved in cell wall biosynthesis
VHDGEPFVREAVASVLGQSFTDLELLVVDDASTDGTVHIVESFGDPRVRLLRNERNVGQVPSLNLGLRVARGELVSRLDADDRMLPSCVSRQVDALDARPDAALAGTWMRIVDERGRPYATLRGSVTSLTDFVHAILVDRYPWAHPSIAFRRDAVLALGGYDPTLAPAEDKDLFRRLALAGHAAISVDEALVLYRTHGAQLSQEHRRVQLANDHIGQERFIDALSPGAPSRALRLLLGADPAFWDDDVTGALEGLDALVAGAAAKVDVDRTRLRELLAARVLEVARSKPLKPRSVALVRCGIARIPSSRRGRALAAHAAALATSPARSVLRYAVRLLASGVDRVPPLRALRGPARRSRVARMLYGKLLGTG